MIRLRNFIEKEHDKLYWANVIFSNSIYRMWRTNNNQIIIINIPQRRLPSHINHYLYKWLFILDNKVYLGNNCIQIFHLGPYNV